MSLLQLFNILVNQSNPTASQAAKTALLQK